MSNLRVLQIVGDPVGGIRKHVHDILQGLCKEFNFFYISSSGGDAAYLKEINNISKVISGHLKLDIRKPPSFVDIANMIKIYKYICKENIDIVHGHGAKGGLYARICGRMAGCKVIYTPHGGVVHSMFGKYENSLYILTERFLCKITDLFIFESNYTAKAFNMKCGCSKVEKIVNYNGVQPIEECQHKKELINRLGDNNSPIRLGVFGLMREQKGQHIALQAVSSLIKNGYNLQLHFYGDGPLRNQLQNDVNEAGLRKYFYFHGEVEDVYHYMGQVDFVLIPSLFESFGYVAVEAMFAKKPIISSNAGGLKEVVLKDFAFIFESGRTASLEKVIIDAINMDSNKVDIIIDGAYSYALNRFQLCNMLMSLKEIYLHVKNT